MKKNSVNMAKAIALLLAALMLCAVFSSCGGRPNNAADPTPTPETLLASTPAPTPSYGGTLRLAMPMNADESNPLKVNTEELLCMYSLVFESLLSVENDGSLTPELAENWSVDDTGLVWTLKLRNAARWHDTGSAITALDVIETFEKIQSLGSDSYYSYVLKNIESIVSGEENTVIVTMKHKGYASLYALTFPVMEKSSTAIGNYPAGTGPYKYEFVSAETVRLTASTNWWKQDPYIEKIEFLARSNNEVALASFVAGQLDMVMTSALSVGRYRDEGNSHITDIMTQNVEVMLVNYTNTALRDVKMRQALAYAINRSKIITNVYMNRARECDVPVPPDSWLYEPKSKIYDYNMDVALALFNECGYADTDGDGYLEKDGVATNELTFTLLVNDSTDSARKTAAEQIKAQLEETGIHIEITTAGFALGDNESEYMAKLSEGAFDLALAGFNLGRDSDLTAYVAFSGARNYGHYNNDNLANLAENILRATDSASCRAAASEFQMSCAAELPFITLYFRLNSVMYTDDVKGADSMREPDVMRGVASWYCSGIE